MHRPQAPRISALLRNPVIAGSFAVPHDNVGVSTPLLTQSVILSAPRAPLSLPPSSPFPFSVLTGLNYLHRLNPPIVHRDVKSANMLVTAEMRVKV